jgi:magnesium chelatase accessory protein
MKLIAPIVTPVATSPRVAGALAALAARTLLVRRLLASTRSALSERQRARYTALFSNPAHVRGTLEFMAGADLQAILEDARTLTIPMTFVVASRDAWVPERRLRHVIARAFPSAHLVGREGGHLWHEEAPAAAAALIRSVLESVLD